MTEKERTQLETVVEILDLLDDLYWKHGQSEAQWDVIRGVKRNVCYAILSMDPGEARREAARLQP